MSDYGSLRRRTRDSGWQWMLIGLALGLGVALVACVGLYAFDAISFPALEDAVDSSDQAAVTIAPNETEIAMSVLGTMSAVNATQTADAAAQVASITDEPPITDVVVPTEEPADIEPQITVSPTTLPGASPTEQVSETVSEVPAVAEPTDDAQPEAVVETPAVTPPLGQPTPTIRYPGDGAAELAPELDAIKSEVIVVTGGSFLMGTTADEATGAMADCALYDKVCDNFDWVSDSTPTHQVTVDTFQMEVTEVTLQQYVTYLNWLGPNSHKSGCQGQPCALTTLEEPERSYIDFDGEAYSVRIPEFYSNHPVTFVTWWGAKDYCEAVGRRLPTEAEWERAARGPDNFIYPWGFEFDVTLANSSVPAAEGTEPVEAYPSGASPYGVLGMAGNVSEWVSDWYQSNYYSQSPAVNPTGPLSGTEKVHRGGSWDTIPLFLRTVHRLSADPVGPTAAIGFRCVEDMQTGVTPPNTSQNSSAAAAESSGETSSGAPTLPPAPTQAVLPTATRNVPTATLAPG